MNEARTFSSQENPLEHFRATIRSLKDVELDKKRRKEGGDRGITWNPHFERIDPNRLTDDDRITFEELGTLSNDEFKERRRRRLRDYAVKPGSDQAEKFMEELTGRQRTVMERLIESGLYVTDTPEAESIDTFWQYMANEMIRMLLGAEQKRTL